MSLFNSCWLSRENGLIYAFFVPCLLVILVSIINYIKSCKDISFISRLIKDCRGKHKIQVMTHNKILNILYIERKVEHTKKREHLSCLGKPVYMTTELLSFLVSYYNNVLTLHLQHLDSEHY